MGWYKCENCGKRNPFHTCYTGGTKTQLFIDSKTEKAVQREMELNLSRGHSAFKGIPKEYHNRYMAVRERAERQARIR